MPPTSKQPFRTARSALAITLMALVATPPGFAQSADADALRRLQEENAALRRRIAELESASAPAAAQPAPGAPSAPASTGTAGVAQTRLEEPAERSSDPNLLVLSPFEVQTERDYGYLRTNTATATRIGTEIQKVPLSISVLSSDFVDDTGMRDIQDVLRYVASASGDPRMGIRQPGNSATPSGTMTLRGFPISQRLRNGVFRYTAYSLDNVDRVEIIKGPAAIFYGVGYPGGVINYVTKKPSFADIPTTFSYGYGGEGSVVGDQRIEFDHNTVLNDRTAFRVVGAWNNFKGDKNHEFNKGFSVTPSVTIKPFKNNQLIITAEVEHTEFRRNQDDSSWIYNEQYFADYRNPSASLLTAAGINPSAPNALATWQQRMGIGGVESLGRSYLNWVNYKRIELNNPRWAAYQTAERGAFYNDLNGNRVHDEKFNFYGMGSSTDQSVDTLEITVDSSPTEWLDTRYVFTHDDASFEWLTNAHTPLANGEQFFAAAPSQRGDFRESQNHQLDIVLKGEFFGVQNKLLFGGLYNLSKQRYTGNGPYLWNNIPGSAEYDPNLPDNGTTNIPPWLNNYSWGLAFQTLTDRYGNKLNAYNLFARHDPAYHPPLDVSRINRPDRSIVDAGEPEREEYYVNYLADLLDNRLHLMGGYRWTYNDANGGQQASSNPPWYNGEANLFEQIDPSLWDAYGIGVNSGFNPYVRNPDGSYQPARPLPTSQALGSYYQGTFQNTKGTSYMVGASYDITPEISVYASRSQSFRPTSAGGAIYTIDQLRNRATLLGLDPEAELARVREQGADTVLGNEEGINTEVGLKTSLWESKLVSTFSLFQLDRVGEALPDVARDQADILNYTGPNRTGTFTTAAYTDPVTGTTSSGIRWYSNNSKRRVEGAELEVIWTPMRNYQLVASGSWLWKAETLLDTSIDPTATDVATQNRRYYTYDFRMPGVSEYRLSVFNKYTFNSGGVINGLSVALGARYASEMNISNDTNFDSKNGGLTAGDYVVFDGNLAYPWALGDYQIVTSLNVTNLFDKEYAEGGGAFSGAGYNLSPPRTWMLTNTLKF